MNKQIIFSLLLITVSTVIHGMKTERLNNIQTNTETTSNYMWSLTKYICSNNKYKPCIVQDDIRALYATKKSFHGYYAQETVKQQIISLCILHDYASHKTTALALGCHAIYAKINRFIAIAKNKEKQFTNEDLQDSWYLTINDTCFSQLHQEFIKCSLREIAINSGDLKKASILLDHIK